MNLKEKISSFNLTEAEKRHKNGDFEYFLDIMKTLMDNTLSLTECDIDRQLHHYWEKHNLVPLKMDGKLDFFNACWLKVLQELKKLGVGIQKMEDIYNFFYNDIEFIKQFFNKDQLPLLNEISSSLNKEKITKLDNDFYKDLMQIGINKFSILALSILLTRVNTCIYIDSRGKIDAYTFKSEIDLNNQELAKLFSEGSVISISLSDIIKQIINDSSVFSLTETELLIHESATKIIKQIFDEGNIEEISIRLSGDKTPIISITKKLAYSEFYQQIYYLQKKGTFMDMSIKTVDGKIQYFETKEKIKM
jgi:hypothetical protein